MKYSELTYIYIYVYNYIYIYIYTSLYFVTLYNGSLQVKPECLI